jgi:hypothetical protein
METGAPGGEIVIDEWVDGGGIRAAAEGHSPTGQLLWVVLNDLDGDESRFRMYLPPNGADNPRGTLIVRPTAREFSDAMAQFPERERSALSSYLSRRRLVYEPVWSDRLQNRTLLRLESRGGHTVGTLGLAPWTTPDGKPGYRLSEIDPTYPWLERRGAMLVGKPARLERVRYVEGGSYLTLRETTDYRLADGGGFSGERIIVSTRRTPRTVETDARFELRIPAGTPVFRAGALEELRAIAAALTK